MFCSVWSGRQWSAERNNGRRSPAELLISAPVHQKDAELVDARERHEDARRALVRVLEELEAEVGKAEDDERSKDARPVQALPPTDEERAEDTREDERCAVEEQLLDRRFVPAAFLPAGAPSSRRSTCGSTKVTE